MFEKECIKKGNAGSLCPFYFSYRKNGLNIIPLKMDLYMNNVFERHFSKYFMEYVSLLLHKLFID